MSVRESTERRGLQVSVKVASRSVAPGDRCAGFVVLRADRGARATALRVVARMLRREKHEGDVREVTLPVNASISLGAFALSEGVPREVPFTVSWPRDLASSVPNQLDYDLVATAVTDDETVEASSRVLVLPALAGDNATLPIGPAWVSTGTACEAEDDDGRWRHGEVENVHGLMVLVRWSDGAPSAWLPVRRLRERDAV